MKTAIVLSTLAAVAMIFGLFVVNSSDASPEPLIMSSSINELSHTYGAEECTD